MLFVFWLLNCRSPLYILDITSLSHICFTNTQFISCLFILLIVSFTVLFIFFIYFILFFNFIILYWFCHISTWIRHRYTRVPHPQPSSLLPPPSPYHPSGLSQCTSPKHPVSCIEPGLAFTLEFTWNSNIYSQVKILKILWKQAWSIPPSGW